MTSVAVPRFEPRTRIAGKYLLRRRIAIGGMGEVWVATNEATHADVALKALRRAGAARTEGLQIEERFRQEARLSAMLSHRSIVKVYDMIEEPDGTLVLVMELLRGESLRRYLKKRGPLGAKEAVAIIAPVLGALGHAHERGIVHRDVNPSNIFLAVDPDGHVTPKLLDFGIAKLEKGEAPVQTQDGRVLGTPRYLSPERIRSASEVDGRADLFSAAVVLYETMTGVSPFAAGNNPAAELAAVIERHIDPDERIDPRLWVEIQRAMSKSPDERHPTAHELAAALTASIDETEESLQAWLNQTAQLPGWDPAPQVLPSERPGAMADEHSAVVLAAKRKLSSAIWLGAAALVVAGVVIAVFVAARPRTRTPTHAESAVATVPVPTPGASSPGPDPTATTTATAKPIPTQNATPQVRPAARPRPVATTPGF